MRSWEFDREQHASDLYAAIIGYYHAAPRTFDATGREVLT
jgi:hypothetical protein